MALKMVAVVISLLMVPIHAQEDDEVVTGTIYVNNNFTFYINGELVAKDPVEIAPHNAYNVTFTIPKNKDVTYGFTCIDFANAATGLVLDNRCLGLGGFRAFFSNGVVTNSSWKCWTSLYGPVNWQTCYAAADRNNTFKVQPFCFQDDVPPLTGCYTLSRQVAEDWNLPTFDDSYWEYALEWEDNATIWGKRPTGCDVPNTVISSEVDRFGNNLTCPEWIDWGTSNFIWREDLILDNTIHCRYTVRAAGGTVAFTPLAATLIILLTILSSIFN